MENKKNKCPKCGSEKFLGIKYLVEERYYDIKNGVIDYSNDPFIEYDYVDESPMFAKCENCKQIYYTERIEEYGNIFNIDLNKPLSEEELEKYLYI